MGHYIISRLCCLIKASGYTSGDDPLDDRETEEEMMKNTQERKHGTAQVGCDGQSAGSENLEKICSRCSQVVSCFGWLHHRIKWKRTTCLWNSAWILCACVCASVCACVRVLFSVPVPCLIPPQAGSQSDPKDPIINTDFLKLQRKLSLRGWLIVTRLLW